MMVGASALSCSDDDGSDAGGGETCLEGAWECWLPDGSTAEMTISGDMIDGSFAVMGVSATVMSTITVDGSTVSVIDTSGTGACPESQRGEYTFVCGDSTLDFTQVSDDCAGRQNFFACEWTRP